MSYRSEQKQGEGKSSNLDAYYTRKQSVKHNQLRGEAEPLHDSDRDAEVANFKGESRPPRPKESPAKGYNPTSSTVWDDEPWKDKEQSK